MSNNINTLNIPSTLYANKISQLSQSLNNINQSIAAGQTNEELIIEANKLLSSFYQDLSGPIFLPKNVLANTRPEVDDFNSNLQNVLSDLTILFNELPNIGSIEIANFDFITTASNNLIAKLKAVDSKLGDYILFSTDLTRDSIYTSDSFNDFSKIDNNSSLLNNTQCNIDTDQGIITLPMTNSVQSNITITTLPAINSNSNGVPGNNYEKGAATNSNISVILDDNPDTWFEYERVVFADSDNKPLILDLTLNLSVEQIINFIRINPNNFGTKNSITITDISTSIDGKNYLSIKDDIPLSSFRTEDEDNIFVLSPSTSKFAGEGIYSFLPRLSRYIHITLVQNNTYNIIDQSGTVRSRYAIGIRDIEIAKQQFDTVGELVSLNYLVNDEVKKVSISTTQNPIETSPLASIEHYISPDNGLTWNRLEPTDFTNDDSSIIQILNFNTVDMDSISTATPVQSIRYKAILRRNTDAFSSIETTIIPETEPVSELFQVPTQTPFKLILNRTPNDNNIVVLDPFFGSCGLQMNRYKLGIGNGSQITISIQANFIKTIPNKISGLMAYATNEIIRVNGVSWNRGNLITSGPNDNIYELDIVNNQIKFGDGINGKAVSVGSVIDIMFHPERLFIQDFQQRIAQLNYPLSNDQNSVQINWLGSKSVFSEKLKLSTNQQSLSNKYILPNTIVFSNTLIFTTEILFVNGSVELVNQGEYSVDYINGIIYSKTATPATSVINITYYYSLSGTLSSDEWSFINDGQFNKLTINSDSLFTIKIDNEIIPAGVTYFNLKNQSLLKGTINFNDNTSFKREVDFINGDSELNLLIQTTETISTLNYGINTIQLKLKISSDHISFSNSQIFSTRVFNLVDIVSAGEYYLDIINNTITIFAAALTTIPGTMNYFYSNRDTSNIGLYSINYNTGEVFTITPTNINSTISYSYTNYFISYNIARFVESDDFIYDKPSNSIVLDEREILNRTSNSILNSNSTQSNFYQVVFNSLITDNSNLEDLEPYFSPVLKDYAIRIITESLLLL